jgi:hypothetical protein
MSSISLHGRLILSDRLPAGAEAVAQHSIEIIGVRLTKRQFIGFPQVRWEVYLRMVLEGNISQFIHDSFFS